MVSEIEEIQKLGRTEGKAQLQPVAPIIPEIHHNGGDVLEFKAPEPQAPVVEVAAPAAPAKISLQLTGNITVALQIENSDEVVEIRQVENMIEIRFNDGKAVHLPLKNVA